MIENYKVTSNIIESAYEIMEMSDNGFSFREVEEYIIILKNCFDKET
jgi:hypothetical protein